MTTSSDSKMKVEIWSDIMCPFCYIGKRNYESAISQFTGAADIELVWRSFQLDPDIPRQAPKVSVYQYLAERKGISYEQSVQMHQRVIEMAKQAGLSYDFDKAIVANSYDAHRLIQLAKQQDLGDAAEERLFRAYFTEGADVADHSTLIRLGLEIGLDENTVREALQGDNFGAEVQADIREAREIGVTGVPFFVFDRKYAVSGAQPPAVFLETLHKSFGQWQQSKKPVPLQFTEGPACTPEGECKD